MKKFNIGDRVILKKDYDGIGLTEAKRGYKGKIVGGTGTTLCVEFDKNVGGHDGNGYGVKGKKGHCWWFTKTAFENSFDLIQKSTQKLIITVNGAETLARLYEGDKVVKTATAKCSPDDTFNFETGAKLAVGRLFTTTEQKAIKIEVGKSYWLKPYDEVKAHFGIGMMSWKRIQKNPVKIKEMKTCGVYTGETVNEDEWAFLPEHFAKEAPQYYNGKVVCVSVSGGYFAYTVGKIYEFIDGRVKIDNGSIVPSDKSGAVTSLEDWNGRYYTRAKFIPLVEGE